MSLPFFLSSVLLSPSQQRKRQQSAELEQQLRERQLEQEKEAHRQRIIEEEREKLLREYAPDLSQFLPKGVFRTAEEYERFMGRIPQASPHPPAHGRRK